MRLPVMSFLMRPRYILGRGLVGGNRDIAEARISVSICWPINFIVVL